MAFVFEDIDDLSYVKHITLDISGGVSHKFISAKQGDNNTRYLGISLTENDVPIEMLSDIIPRIRATKPDGNCVFNDGILHEGEIYIELTDQLLAVPGNVQCDIGLYREDRVLSTVTFFLDVAVRPLDENKLRSSGEFLSLEKYVNEAKAVADSLPIKFIECLEYDIQTNTGQTPIILRELETGVYVLNGYFKAFESSDEVNYVERTLVLVEWKPDVSFAQLFYPNDNRIGYVEITDENYTLVAYSLKTDTHYNSESNAAQSGKAVAEAIADSVGQINSVLATLVEVEEV